MANLGIILFASQIMSSCGGKSSKEATTSKVYNPVDICKCLTEPGNSEWSMNYRDSCRNAISKEIGVDNWEKVNMSKNPDISRKFDALAERCASSKNSGIKVIDQNNKSQKVEQKIENNNKKELNKHSAEIKIQEWINIVKKNCIEEDFEYKDIEDYKRTADFNGDGLVDYLLWEGGVICEGRTAGYFGNAGPHITFLISSSNGYNFHEGFSSYELSELPITKENGLDVIIIEGTQLGKDIKVKWKWNGNTINIQK